MNMRKKLLLSALLACAPSLTLAANDPYLSIMGTYVHPDQVRLLDDGLGANLILGFPLNDYLSTELNLGGFRSTHTYDTKQNVTYTTGLDLRFGMPNLVQDFTPFLLIGGGGERTIRNNPYNITNGYANAGLGVLWNLGGPHHSAIRLEGRRVASFSVDYSPNHDRLYDNRISLGAEMSFGPPPAPPARAPEPAPAPKAAPPDSDHDGVLDGDDLCPGTPVGTEIDAHGCPLPPKDSDSDGVPDTQDACPNTSAGLKVDARGCAVKAQAVVLRNVNFELNSSTLTAAAQGLLDHMVSAMQGQPSMKVRIEGHTDSQGSAAYNLKLSQKRAEAVRAYLISKGIAGSRIQAKGMGESQPTASNATKDGRALNRRVEFHILSE